MAKASEGDAIGTVLGGRRRGDPRAGRRTRTGDRAAARVGVEPPRLGADRTPARRIASPSTAGTRAAIAATVTPIRPPPGRPVSVERMADDLHDLLDHFRLERPVIVGHSMGALTFWAYIARHGCGRLDRIGVIDQSPRLITDADWRLGIYGDWSACARPGLRCRDAGRFRDRRHRAGVVQPEPARARAATWNSHPSIDRVRTYLAMLDPGR